MIQVADQQNVSGRSSRWWLRTDGASTFIAASADHIYALVADLPRMGEWSPECRRVEWLDGTTGPSVGARFVGHNVGGPKGLMKWSRRGRVLAASPSSEFVFVTEEGGKEGTKWSYRFEPAEGGTVVTESYEVSKIPFWARILDIPTNRAAELQDSLVRTLEHLKAAAERGDAR
jgi:Polyketide cyclase / dehydrase and lipid transport